jgi:hypothetical protein
LLLALSLAFAPYRLLVVNAAEAFNNGRFYYQPLLQSGQGRSSKAEFIAGRQVHLPFISAIDLLSFYPV